MYKLTMFSVVVASFTIWAPAARVEAQSSTEICSILIWQPDGPQNSAKCFVVKEDGTTDLNHLVAQAINTVEDSGDTRIDLKMINPNWRFCPFDLTRIRCTASGNWVDWTDFEESTTVWYDGTIPLLALTCSCY